MLPGIKLFDLSGKTAIITGGSKGLGLAMAEGLASAGANVMLVSRNLGGGEESASRITELYGVKAIAFEADVVNKEQTEAMAKAAFDAFGRIDILIKSAGINIRGAIDELQLEEFSKVMDINVTGTWLCCKAVTPYMKEAGKGSI